MNEHKSLVFRQPVEKQFKEILEQFSPQLEQLKLKYEELKETDLTVCTLAELTDRLNRFEQKMDT